MPSYAAAPEERPVTPATAVPGPARQLAQRKNATGAGRPPNPLCCGRPTKRIATGSSIVRCQVCEKTYAPGDPLPPQTAIEPAPPPAERIGPHCPKCATPTREREGRWWCKWCELGLPQDAAAADVSPKPAPVSRTAPEVSPAPSPFAAGRRGPKPSNVLGTGLSERELKQLREDLAPLAPPAPGLNGDHATRAEERSKIPPSRPANNSRGDDKPWRRRQTDDAPEPLLTGVRAHVSDVIELANEFMRLGPWPDRLEVPAEWFGHNTTENKGRMPALRKAIETRCGKKALATYTSADRKVRVLYRAGSRTTTPKGGAA